MDMNLYDLPEEQLKDIPTVCGSLRESMEALQQDYEFLTKGDVFTEDMLESYIELKMEEIDMYETTPHPIEYHLYYSS